MPNTDKKRRSLADHQSKQRAAATAANDAAFAVMDIHAAEQFFDKRGFSRGTIAALAAHGIGLPEELLFMTEAQILQIPGLGNASLEEVRAYKARFT